MVDCPTCDESFDTERGMKIHHSRVHGESIATQEYECKRCGDSFTGQTKNDPVYCSRSCSGTDTSAGTGSDHHNYSERVDVTCAECGNTKSVIPSVYDSRDQFFCDNDCRHDWLTGRTQEDQHERTTVYCVTCGTPKSVYPHEAKNQERHFCDKQCYGTYISETRCGKNHPNWRDDTDTERGDEWDKIREIITERDNYECINCGISEKRVTRSHDVHHINPRRNFDDVNNSNFSLNLITLCRSCHMKLEKVDTITMLPSIGFSNDVISTVLLSLYHQYGILSTRY